MLYDEFPHEVEMLTQQKISDGMGGFKTEWIKAFGIDAFVDTPTSRQRYEAQQMSNPLDRYMYYEYRTDIISTMRIKHGEDIYTIAGKPEDQGGANEIMRVALKLVP